MFFICQKKNSLKRLYTQQIPVLWLFSPISMYLLKRVSSKKNNNHTRKVTLRSNSYLRSIRLFPIYRTIIYYLVLRHKRKRSTEIIYLYESYNKNDILNGYLLCIGRYVYVGVVSSMYGC